MQDQNKKCEHNWVMDGHNAGDPICSRCYKRPEEIKKHKWKIELVEYYDMDSDWVCEECNARVRREFPRKEGGGLRDTRETLEEFKIRLKSPWQAWRKIPEECSGK